MLLDAHDLRRLNRVVKQAPEFVVYHLMQNPHLILTSDAFDELRLPSPDSSWGGLADLYTDEKIHRDLTMDWASPDPDDDTSCFNYCQMSHQKFGFRNVNTGAWCRWLGWSGTLGLPLEHELLFTSGEVRGFHIPIGRLIDDCQKRTVSSRSSAIFIQPWRPKHSQVSRHTRDLLSEISSESRSLSEVSDRDLEEIVAELLKSKGLDVTITPKTRDGGRDVIARGELIPGEPTVIAVETKRRATVGIDDLRSCLYANRHFPLILLSTSGRFSAGVVQEAARSENAFRLLLKDGLALRQWIHEYFAKGAVR